MEVKISAKAFAEFVIGGTAKKLSTIRALLRPKSPEAAIPIGYYTTSIGIIRRYHDGESDLAAVANAIRKLHEEADSAPTPQARAKRLCNARAVELYMKEFSGKKWKVVPCPRIAYTAWQVRVSGTPDLAILDKGRLRLVKLGVRKEKKRLKW